MWAWAWGWGVGMDVGGGRVMEGTLCVAVVVGRGDGVGRDVGEGVSKGKVVVGDVGRDMDGRMFVSRR